MRKLLSHSPRATPRRQDSTSRFATGLACLALVLICLPAAVQGQVIFSDSFTNSGTINPWISEVGNWTEAGGQMVGGLNSTTSYGYAYVTNNAADYTVQAQIHFSTTGAYGGGIGGRLNPTNGARYAAWVFPENSTGPEDVLILFKFQTWSNFSYNSGTFMQQVSLAGYGGVGTNAHTLKLGFTGNQITVFYDTNQVISTTDVEAVPYASGAISLDFYTDAPSYDFYVDNLQMTAESTVPVASNDSYNAVSGRLLSVAAPGVLANDTGGLGPLSAILLTSPAHGAFSFSTNGGFSYTPATNFTGTDSFTYKATDGHTNSSAATVTLTVSAVQPPAANNDSYTGVANTTLTVSAPGVLTNDTDADGFTLTALLASGPTNGVLNLGTNGGFTYTPATNFSGTDSFTYYASDGVLDSASPATATITVLPATTLFLDNFLRSTNPGPISPWLLESGDWAVADGELVETGITGGNYGYVYLTNIWTDYSVQAQVQFSTTNAWGGGIGGRLNVTNGAHYGAWVYPEGSPGGSNVLKLIKFQNWTTFGYNGSNGVPMESVSVPEVGTNVHTLKLAFLRNQIAVYYDGVEMISMADTDSGGSPYLTGGVSADNWTYETAYDLSYQNVIVGALANNDSYVVNEDTPLTVPAPGVLGNDTDGFGTNLNAVQMTGPANGSLSFNTNGGFTYTPNNGFLGQDSFTYQATDGTNNLGTATVYLTVSFLGASQVFSQNFDSVTAPALPSGWTTTSSGAESNWMTTAATNNTAPNSVFVGDPTNPGLASLISPSIALPVGAAQLSFGNDYNLEDNPNDTAVGFDGGQLQIKIGTNAFTDIIAAGGRFVSNGYNAIIYCCDGNQISNQPAWSGNSGGFINTVVDLPESASGQTIQLKWVCGTDNGNGPGDWEGWYIDTVTISSCALFSCWNLAPVLPAQVTVTNNELTLLTVTNTATEPNDDATTTGYALVNPPAGASISTNGIITWTPSQTQSHTTNTITTVVTNSDPSDPVTPQLTATNSFKVVVREVNVAPTLPSQTNRISAGLAAVIVTNTATNANIHATNSGYVLTTAPGGASISSNGIITWTPLASQVPSTNLFTTVVTNSDPFDLVNPHLTATNSFTVTVNTVHNGPSLTNQNNRTNNELVLLTVTNTAMDTDVPALTLTYMLVAPTPTNVSISTNGIITWTPGQNQSPSTNTIKTVVTDNGTPNLSATNSFTVVVKEVNVAPSLGSISQQTVNELTLLTVTNAATNANIHATNIGYALVAPTPTNASIDSNGIITWTPGQNQSPGTNTITTVVTNNDPFDLVNPHLTATNSFTVVVKEVNVAPVLPPQSNLITAGLASVTVTNTATNANIHAAITGYVLTSAPGGASISSNGIITWTPLASQVPSTNLFTTVVTNNDPFDLVNPQLTATNSFTVTVNAIHNGPGLPSQNGLTNNELVLLTVTNTAMDTDVPALALTYLLVAPTPANASIDTNGIITWTPGQNQSPGTNTITTVVTDNGTPNLSATNSFTVVVKEVNVAPMLPPQSNLITAGLASVTVTNTATNANIHAVIAGYGLTSAPSGASISTNGIITWTPLASQVPSTNLFTTVVTNNDPFDLVNPQLMATNSFTVTVNAIHNGPSLPSQNNQTVNEQTLLTVTNTAMDTDVPALALTYSLVAPTPGNVNIDTNGIITWTPGQNQSPGTNTIVTVVTDNGTPNLSATNSFTVVVKEVNVAPMLPPQSNLITAGLAGVTVTNTASNANIHATNSGYVLTSAPGGASISSNGIITWTPLASQVPSTNLFTTVVTNNDPFDLVNPQLTATNSFTVTVNAIHNGPSLPSQNGLTNNELVLLTVTNTAVDTDVPALALTYMLVAPTPANASIDTNGIITWTPGQNQSPGTNTIVTVVTDNGTPNLSATNSFTVVVKEVNVAPMLPPQSNLITAGLASVTVTNTATNANIHATITGYGLTSAPGGASISSNGIITWTPNASQVPSTNLFTTVVTNNNPFDLVNPQLTATNSFTVTVNAIHNGPSLPSQTSQTITEPATLAVTNTAMDTDVPALALTYSLVAPTPANASISTNGIITWTPNAGQAPSTNTITTVVTDNGTPNLSATNSFTVVVISSATAPFMQSITASNGSVVITWSSVIGRSYRPQYKTDLNATNWNNITPDVLATGPTSSITNNPGNASQVFYRIGLLP